MNTCGDVRSHKSVKIPVVVDWYLNQSIVNLPWNRLPGFWNIGCLTEPTLFFWTFTKESKVYLSETEYATSHWIMKFIQSLLCYFPNFSFLFRIAPVETATSVHGSLPEHLKSDVSINRTGHRLPSCTYCVMHCRANHSRDVTIQPDGYPLRMEINAAERWRQLESILFEDRLQNLLLSPRAGYVLLLLIFYFLSLCSFSPFCGLPWKPWTNSLDHFYFPDKWVWSSSSDPAFVPLRPSWIHVFDYLSCHSTIAPWNAVGTRTLPWLNELYKVIYLKLNIQSCLESQWENPDKVIAWSSGLEVDLNWQRSRRMKWKDNWSKPLPAVLRTDSC